MSAPLVYVQLLESAGRTVLKGTGVVGIKIPKEDVSGAAEDIQEFARQARPNLSTSPVINAIPFWVAAVFAGMLCVGFAFVFDRVSDLALEYFTEHPLLGFVIAPSCFLVAWALVFFFAKNAAGSGIPQVMAASKLTRGNNYAAGDRLLSVKTAFIKIVSCLFCILGGGAVGREGPTIQISSSIFYSIGRKSQLFFENFSLRPFIIAGGAAGIASAFNTPLGGIVFAIEELAKSRFHVFRGVLIGAVVVAGLISQQMLGHYLYFGFPILGQASLSNIPLALVVGCIAGVMGVFFGKFLELFTRIKRRFFKTTAKLAIFAMVCGLIVALLSYFLGSNSIGPGKKLITDMLFQNEIVDTKMAIGRFFASIVSYLSGSAGGIFAPSLATGAAIGQKIATIAGSESLNLMALLGMISFLTGVTRAPFTAFVLVLEMTDRHSAIIVMMLAALTGYAMARLFGGKSFYEVMEAQYIQENKTG